MKVFSLRIFKTTILGWLYYIMPIIAFSQDIQFSQFYTNSLYLSPSFAGITPYTRVMAHQRVQWPSLDAKYLTTMVGIDKYFEKYKSGVGLTILRDYQGFKNISSTEVNLLYSYEISLSEKFMFRPGLQAGFASRYMDYTGLVYPDQYNDNGFSGPSESNNPNVKITYPDFGSGGIFYSEQLWIGVNVSHINRPQQSFLQGNSRLPSKYTFVAGYKIRLNHDDELNKIDPLYVIPTVHYKLQGKSDQIDFGLYGLYKPAIFGVWYRGIPVKHYRKDLPNNESIVVLAGWKLFNFSISYSYDFTVSRLHRAKTGGSHELSIVYLFRNLNKPVKPMKKIPCPDLYNK